MSGTMTLDQLRDFVSGGEIDTILVVFPDMQGRLLGKRVTGHYFLDHGLEQFHVCDYLLAVDMDMEPVPGYKASSWERGYGDFPIRPDLTTLRLIPWLPATALVMADCLDHDGNDLAHSPRAILKRQTARAKAMGYDVMMASELELYIFNETFESAHKKGYKDLEASGWYTEDYHIFQTSKEEELIRAIRNGMDAAGIEIEFSKGEWSPGQEEINLRYTDALAMADRHTIYKNGAKEIAYQQGKALTFMAKWRDDMAGNSCHVHTSLWNDADNSPAFVDATHPDGTSELFRHFLAGQLSCAREMTYFLAPYINSYKRFSSGTFAPTKAIWSRDNRTAGFRVLGPGVGTRVECRVPGGDCNVYLAFAALIAAGLHGIDNKLELEPEFRGDAYKADDIREIPKTLREALELLDKSDVYRAAFGDDVVEHYLHTGRWEQSEFDRHVTDWEVRRNFERA
jgi:glutamine synthetase